MPLFQHGKISVELDDHGFMLQPEMWNDKVAAALAADEGIDQLTDEHWRIIDFLRDYQEEKGRAPMIRVLCKETGFSLKRIYELFEKGPAKGACRVAGLPRPDSCV
jgi:TusE/DsrC/DsvC family sulfur relay protein